MKKCLNIFFTIVLLLSISACSPTTFDGNRVGNEKQLVMDYKVLNKTDYQMLELEAGDIIEFTIVSQSGEVDIVLKKEGSTAAYSGVDIPTSSFQVEINESGTFKVSVTGKNAKGSVSILVVEND